MKFAKAVIALATIIMLAGCGVKPWIDPTTPMDTPENSYSQGMRFLEEENYDKAMQSFERAKGLNPKYAPAYEGVGLVHLARGNFEQAIESFKESIDKDDQYAKARIGLGRVYLAQSKPKSARKQFDKAIKLDPENADAYYYKGETYMAEHEFHDAEYWFSKALAKNPGHGQADKAWQKANKIRRAAPGTKLGEEICLKEKISRADLCILIVEELKLDKIYKLIYGKDSTEEATQSVLEVPDLIDLDGHRAEKYIRIVAKYGILGQYPDHRFYPDKPITRAEFAIAVQDILISLTKEDDLKTKFVSSPSPFSDVKESNYAYNAILLTTTRGVLSADVESGAFHPLKVISGADALIGLRQLKIIIEK